MLFSQTRGEVERRLAACGGEVAAVEEGAGVVPVIARVEGDGRGEVAKRVVAVREVCCCPEAIVIAGVYLWEAVEDVPADGAEVGESEGRAVEVGCCCGDDAGAAVLLERQADAVKCQFSGLCACAADDFNVGRAVQVAGQVDATFCQLNCADQIACFHDDPAKKYARAYEMRDMDALGIVPRFRRCLDFLATLGCFNTGLVAWDSTWLSSASLCSTEAAPQAAASNRLTNTSELLEILQLELPNKTTLVARSVNTQFKSDVARLRPIRFARLSPTLSSIQF